MHRSHLLGKTNFSLRPLRRLAVACKLIWLRKRWGMDIDPGCDMSLSAKLDKVYPAGIHIGAQTYIAFRASILTHDMPRGLFAETWIGKNCFIGAGAFVLPGVHIGDGCIIGAGSVVTSDIPPNSLVAGNPARILQTGIETGKFGILSSAEETENAFFETRAASGQK